MDKLKHFIISFLLTILLGWKIALAIGLIKEVWDYFTPPHQAEIGDIVADVGGILLGVVVLR